MKKIVALVLSLVMVLGLATTAFAADKYAMYSADGTQEVEIEGDVTYTTAAGQTVVNGVVQAGTVDFYTVNETKYVITDEACADYRLVKNGKVMFVMALEDYAYTAVVKAYDLVKTGCAKEAYAEGVKAVYVKTNLNPTELPTYYVEDAQGVVVAKLGDKLVKLTEGEKATFVEAGAHVWDLTTVVYDSKTGAVASVLCKVCNAKAVAAETLPVGYEGKAVVGDAVLTGIDADAIWYVAGTGSAAAVDGDKVESAQTFDAGIAMYVGMSVMAAAGSAVVLKKKD